MGTKLDGTSLFTGISSSLNNTYSVLSSTFKDGVTLANLNSTEATTALTTNFSSLDKNHDGKLTADELSNFTNTLATTGLSRDQLYTLGSSSGMSSSLLNTVIDYFDEIDTNKDGKVTNAEIQDFSTRSEKEKQRKEDLEKMLSNMSTFYESNAASTGSLLDYKYLQDDNS